MPGALARLETRLKRRDVAAVIMEPIAMNLGVLIPETEFMEGLAPLCHRYGTLLILDEVATGFGRTGKLFACEHYDVQPDMMTIAKAATGGAAGIGGLAAARRARRNASSRMATCLLHLRLAPAQRGRRHRQRALDQAESSPPAAPRRSEPAPTSRQRLRAMEFPEEPELRSRGLAIAVDVRDENTPSAWRRSVARADCFSIPREVLLMLPALNVDRSTVKAGLDIVEACL